MSGFPALTDVPVGNGPVPIRLGVGGDPGSVVRAAPTAGSDHLGPRCNGRLPEGQEFGVARARSLVSTAFASASMPALLGCMWSPWS